VTSDDPAVNAQRGDASPRPPAAATAPARSTGRPGGGRAEGPQSQFAPDEIGSLIGLRRELHRHPELSWKEEATAGRLEAFLRNAGVNHVRRVAATGVVARLPGAGAAPTVAIRGDMDALPIQEETGLPFASESPGVMHACGHDVHATWAVGAALLLKRDPAPGDVIVVFQPAEEVGAGARAVLDSGALDGAVTIFGGHVDRRFPVGQVVADPGAVAASSDTFTVTLTGRGAHGARPHEGADPIVGAAAIVTALQTIVSRRLDPGVTAVVTVGMVHGGSAPNVIPQQVALSGTLRAMVPEVRAALREHVGHLATTVAAAYGLAAEIAFGDGTPPVVNTARETAWARRAAEHVLGPGSVVPFGLTNMGAEDFAVYLERMPGCFLRIGAREEGGGVTPAHSSRFVAAEESIFVGAAVLAECARVAGHERMGDG
jgi:amidohydrolase